jgi:CTP:molybdopterin cytidylyltransferase MocA
MPAIILAAGASRRLGHPKQLVLVEGETLLGRTMRVAREAGADPIFVVLGGNQASIEAGVDFTNVDRVQNADWEKGIATSIHAGIEALYARCPDASAALILACDQLYLTAGHLRSLIETHRVSCGPTIVASRYKGMPGIPAVFPDLYFSELLRLRGDTGARHLLRAHDRELAWVEFAGGEFDIDSPSDLAALFSRPELDSQT